MIAEEGSNETQQCEAASYRSCIQSAGPAPLSIIAFPRDGDPYTECFYGALEPLGVEVREGVFSGMWLLRNLRNIDYVHLHWPSYFYNVWPRRRCLSQFGLFLFLLALARWRGARVLWTVHNLYPHETCAVPLLDTLARWVLVRATTRFLLHGASAEADFRRAFPAGSGRTTLIGIGAFPVPHSNTVDRSAARAHFGLAGDDFVFLFFGNCRPYKNLEGLVRAFQELPGHPVLIIAGRFLDEDYESTIRTLVEQSRSRIIFRSGFVPDEQVQVYMQASDVVVAPYLDCLSSGTASLALSFGLPLIGPALGSLRDLIIDGCGILYSPSRSDGLRDAMLAARNMRFDRSRILAQVAAQDWSVSARTVRDNLLMVTPGLAKLSE